MSLTILHRRRLSYKDVGGFIANFRVGKKYATAFELLFDEVLEAVKYEVYVNGLLHSEILKSGDYVVGLTRATTFDLHIKAVDINDVIFKISATITETTNALVTVPTTGLFSYHKLDDNVQDSYSSYHATNNGGVFIPGKINKGIELTSGAFVNLGDIPFQIANAFSLNVWFKVSSGGAQQLITRDGYPGFRAWQFRLNNGRLNFIRWYNGGSSNRQLLASTIGNDNTWRMGTATFSTTNGMRLYMNGKMEIEDSSYNETGVADSGTPITIGADPSGILTSTGSFDEASMYENYELNPGEVSDLHNNGNGITL